MANYENAVYVGPLDPLDQRNEQEWRRREEIRKKTEEEIQQRQQAEMNKLQAAENKIYENLVACNDAEGIKNLTIALVMIRKEKERVYR